MKQNVVIICKSLEQNENETELSFEQAKFSLSNYWKEDKIEEMLLCGMELFTPYATYKIKNK